MKTLEYLAGANIFIEKEYNQLVKPIYNLVLPRCYLF